MALSKTHIDDLLGSRRDWTPILLLEAESGDAFGPALLELARERRWQLINRYKFDGELPANIKARGALIGLVPTHDAAQELRRLGIPMVRLGSFAHPDDPRVPAVVPDHAATGRMGAEHFAQRDFKHVACVGHKPWGHNRPTYQAFESRARQLGCACHLLRDQNMPLGRSETYVERMKRRQQHFTDWIRAMPGPVGLLAFSDPAADRYSQWIMDADLRVPEDVAVLGIGNHQMTCECTTVPISSIALDRDRMMAAAVATLAKLIEGRTVEQTTIAVPPLGVVTRQSTDVLGAADPHVARALRFMWDHLTEDLSVQQIVNHVGVSRRTLERAFGRGLGRGIAEEFRRRRLEKACDLLVQTDLRIAAIAQTLSFNSDHQFFRAFRAAYGTSPARYRQQHRSTG